MKIQAKHIVRILIGAAIVVFALGVSLHRTVVDRQADPTGKYIAETTYRTFYSFIPMAPGSSSDKPGFVEIFAVGEGSLGRIPVPMLQMAGVHWEKSGAVIELIGEWDFAKRSCFYWSKDGSRKVYVKGNVM